MDLFCLSNLTQVKIRMSALNVRYFANAIKTNNELIMTLWKEYWRDGNGSPWIVKTLLENHVSQFFYCGHVVACPTTII